MPTIGLISDTHGLVRPGCFTALDGVELILHAGDVGEGVLDELGAIAPVRAVAGNTDFDDEPRLAPALDLVVGGVTIHVSHGHEMGRPKPEALLARYDARVVVFGHTHEAVVRWNGPRVAVNPGAAGPARFNLRPSVARLTVRGDTVEVDIVEL